MDLPLSKEGERQAKEAAKYIGIRPDVVMSSTKKRTIQTAEILFPELYQHVTLPVFDEIFFGDLESVASTEELRCEILKDPLCIRTKYHGDDIWERAQKAIEYLDHLEEEFPDQTVAIVTSDSLLQSIRCLQQHGKVNGIVWSYENYFENCSCYRYPFS